MTAQETATLKEIIERELIKLQSKADELKSFTEPIAPDCAIGRVSRMDAINNKSVFDASLRNTQLRLKALQEASKLIHEPDFGRCLQCHSPIAFERLKIRPEIRKCAKCLGR
jgi:DnaK suppressor protein